MGALRVGELSKQAGLYGQRRPLLRGERPSCPGGPQPLGLSPHDVKRLACIQRAKLMGLPLSKIKDLVVHLSETECACLKIGPHLKLLIPRAAPGHRDEDRPARAAPEGPRGIPGGNGPGELRPCRLPRTAAKPSNPRGNRSASPSGVAAAGTRLS